MLDQNIRVRPPNKFLLNLKQNSTPVLPLVMVLCVFMGAIISSTSRSYGFATVWSQPYVYLLMFFFALLIVMINWSVNAPRQYRYWYGEVVSGIIIDRRKYESNKSYRFVAVVQGQNRAGETITQDIAVHDDVWQTLKVSQSYPWA